jgi:colicin import membrane protein
MSAVAYYEPYKLPAGILAAAVHGIFFALLYFGFAWQAQPSGTMSVELWSSLPGEAGAPPGHAKAEEAAPPPPEKAVKQEATPQPEKVVEPDIALPDKKKLETKPAEAQPEKKKVLPRIADVIAQPGGQGAGSIAGQAARERAGREAAIGRVVNEYTGKIAAKIRSYIVKPPDVADDARAEFLVTLLPGGGVLSARLVKSSGNAAYDDAVERAIIKSQPLPLPADVTMFSKFREIRLGFNSKEQE